MNILLRNLIYSENSVTQKKPLLDLMHIFMAISKKNHDIFEFYQNTFIEMIINELEQLREDKITEAIVLRSRLE